MLLNHVCPITAVQVGVREGDVMSTVNVTNYPRASAGLHYTLFE